MATTITINKRKYTVDTSLFNHCFYKDGTMRLSVVDGRGNRKLAQFTPDGEFELWENPKTFKKHAYSHSINMRR